MRCGRGGGKKGIGKEGEEVNIVEVRGQEQREGEEEREIGAML